MLTFRLMPLLVAACLALPLSAPRAQSASQTDPQTKDTGFTPEQRAAIVRVVREALDEQQIVAAEARVPLVARLAEGVRVAGDRDALRRALVNLLSNALRFSPAGAEVLVASGATGGWAWVAVRDRGPGIDPADHRRIFDRFSRVVGRRARHDGHAGLGLAIVRQIAESHHGTVAVHSAPGQGSTFVVWLPTRAGDSAGTPVPAGVDPLTAYAAVPAAR